MKYLYELIFGPPKVRLTNKAEKIVKTFTKAAKDLEIVNEEITNEQVSIQTQISELQSAATTLEEQKTRNSNFIKNLQNLFS